MTKKQKIIEILDEDLDVFTKYDVKNIIKGSKKIKLKKAKSMCGKPNCFNPDHCTYPKCNN